MTIMPDEMTRSDVRYRLSQKSRTMPNGCIEFIGSTSKRGYGRLTVLGGPRLVHRLAYELKFGDIPRDKHVLHKCDNPICFNTEHLYLGTDQDNSNDMMLRGRSVKAGGEDNGSSKLTDEQVRQIRIECSKGWSRRSIAKIYGVRHPIINGIISGRLWSHVK